MTTRRNFLIGALATLAVPFEAAAKTVRNQLAAFGAIGRKEDLTDVVHTVHPEETPFMQSLSGVQQWQVTTFGGSTNDAPPEESVTGAVGVVEDRWP